MGNKNKKEEKTPPNVKEDVNDLDKAFRKGKQTRGTKRRDEKKYMREVKEGEYGGEFIDNFEKW
jgi:hypothetical protein